MAKTFKTAQGTELPLINLKGKDYLEVKYRIVWFREDHPDWRIETEAVRLEEKASIFKAIIRDAEGNIRAMSHKCETAGGFADHMEKAETGAIGRALALVGFGTQFAPEMEEGERLVDAPAQAKKTTQAKPSAQKDAPLISEPQRNRLFAIKRESGLTDEQMKAILKDFGYASSKDIRWVDYDKIVEKVETSKV